MIAEASSTGVARSTVVPVVPYPRPPSHSTGTTLEAKNFAAEARVSLEPFPIEAFPEKIRLPAENLAEVYRTPVCLAAMTATAVISGAVGKSVVVSGAFRDKSTRLNMYLIAMAERGSGKDLIASSLIQPMEKRSRWLAEEHAKKCADLRAEAGLLKKEIDQLRATIAQGKGTDRENQLGTIQKKQRDMEQMEREINREVSLLLDNFTSEGAHRRLADNGETLCACSPEGGDAVKVAFGKYSKNGQGDYDLILKAYNGTPHDSARAGSRRVPLESPCLTLIWMVQSSVLRGMLGDDEATNRGFSCRPLIINTHARQEYDDRKMLQFQYSNAWADFVDSLLDFRLSAADPRVLRCTPEAREVFAALHDQGVTWERGEYADQQGEFSRLRENAIKVAGVFTLAEEMDIVTQDIATRACAVVRWCVLNYLGFLESRRNERLVRELHPVLDFVNRAGGRVQIGEIEKEQCIDREMLNTLAVKFPRLLRIDKVHPGTPGRPKEFVVSVLHGGSTTSGVQR